MGPIPNLSVPLLALAGTDDTRFACSRRPPGPYRPLGCGVAHPGRRPCGTPGTAGRRRAPRRSLAGYGLTRRSPTARSAPTASCSLAVAPSTGSSSRPSASPTRGGPGRRQAAGRAGPRSAQRGQGQDAAATPVASKRADVEPARPPPAQAHGQGPLAGSCRPTSRRLLACSSAVASRPTAPPTQTANAMGESPQRERVHLHVGRSRPWPPARRRRRRTARPARGNRRDGAHRCRTSRPGSRRRRSEPTTSWCGSQGQPGQPGDAEGRRAATFTGAREASSRPTSRSGPTRTLVGAAHPVGVVIDVVGPDLQGQGHHQRQQHVDGGETREACGSAQARARHAAQLRRTAVRHTARRSAHHHRHGSRGQGPVGPQRARDPEPGVDGVVTDAAGYLEKSGRRCSTKALRPSWPSSVM